MTAGTVGLEMFHNMGRKLVTRVISSAALILCLLAIAVWVPDAGVLVVILGLALWGASEFFGMLDAAQIAHYKVAGLVAAVLVYGVTALPSNFSAHMQGVLYPALLLVVLSVVLVSEFLNRDHSKAAEAVAFTLLSVLYVPFLLSFFGRLLLEWEGPGSPRILILYLVLIVKIADIGAYFTGCSFGRHKMIPSISPAKSWEGFAGGLAAATIVSAGFSFFSGGMIGPVVIPLHHALILGVVLGTVGTLGDLVESLFKRGTGVKDSGRLFRNMGGILDVLDSLLFAAPVLYFYVILWLKPATENL